MTKTETVAKKYTELQQKICSVLKKADSLAHFQNLSWEKEIGNGITCVMQSGHKVDKAAVNFSHVRGDLSKKMGHILGEDAKSYSATGISSIIHPKNPFVPIIHMNVRYFALDNGSEWFGGGIDLTPVYIDIEEAILFHEKLKTICLKYNPAFYDNFKTWADNYFYIPHREETRGVGGIFFDRLNSSDSISFDHLFKFTIELSEAYPKIYSDILQKKSRLPFSEENRKWQSLRRGRYAEFNLIYDRGTKFGLESGGNTESILVSLPPEVNWEYNFSPQPGSLEEQTLNYLKKGINWIEMSKLAV